MLNSSPFSCFFISVDHISFTKCFSSFTFQKRQECLHLCSSGMNAAVLCVFPDDGSSQVAVEEQELTRCVEDVYKVRERAAAQVLPDAFHLLVQDNVSIVFFFRRLLALGAVRSGWWATVHQLLCSKPWRTWWLLSSPSFVSPRRMSPTYGKIYSNILHFLPPSRNLYFDELFFNLSSVCLCASQRPLSGNPAVVSEPHWDGCSPGGPEAALRPAGAGEPGVC